MTKTERDQRLRAILARRAMWERLYPTQYIERFFEPLYDGELDALLDAARQVLSENERKKRRS